MVFVPGEVVVVAVVAWTIWRPDRDVSVCWEVGQW